MASLPMDTGFVEVSPTEVDGEYRVRIFADEERTALIAVHEGVTRERLVVETSMSTSGDTSYSVESSVVYFDDSTAYLHVLSPDRVMSLPVD
jgi:hypothetical protein